MENARVKKLKAFDFLCENRLGVLSTISADNGYPQGSVLYYVIEQKSIYLITLKDSRKLTNIMKNNKVSLTVFSEIPPLVLQIEGTCEVISDPETRRDVATFYMEKANKNPDAINWPPIRKLPNEEGYEFIKLTVDHFKFSDFNEFEPNIVEGTIADWL